MGTESHNTSNITKCTLITPNPLDPLVVCLKSIILHGSVGICVSNARNGQFMHRLIPRRRISALCDRKLHVWCFSLKRDSNFCFAHFFMLNVFINKFGKISSSGFFHFMHLILTTPDNWLKLGVILTPKVHFFPKNSNVLNSKTIWLN